MYESSIEEHRYEGSIAREKHAFESLIHNKAHMVVMKDVSATILGESDAIWCSSASDVNPYVRAELDSRTNSLGLSGKSALQSVGVVVDVRY